MMRDRKQGQSLMCLRYVLSDHQGHRSGHPQSQGTTESNKILSLPLMSHGVVEASGIKNDCVTVGHDLIPACTMCQRVARGEESILPQGRWTAGRVTVRNVGDKEVRRYSGSK